MGLCCDRSVLGAGICQMQRDFGPCLNVGASAGVARGWQSKCPWNPALCQPLPSWEKSTDATSCPLPSAEAARGGWALRSRLGVLAGFGPSLLCLLHLSVSLLKGFWMLSLTCFLAGWGTPPVTLHRQGEKGIGADVGVISSSLLQAEGEHPWLVGLKQPFLSSYQRLFSSS